MRAPRERDVLARRPEDVELLGVAPSSVSSWFAEPMLTTMIDPAGIGTPSTSVSRVAVRMIAEQRRLPAQAFLDRLRHQRRGRRAARRAGRGSVSSPNSRLLDERYVVSAPAGSSRRRNAQISSSVRRCAVELGLREHGDHVVGRVRAALGDDRRRSSRTARATPAMRAVHVEADADELDRPAVELRAGLRAGGRACRRSR